MEKSMCGAQRATVFALARELGMSTRSKDKDDDLHLLIDGLVGKNSMTGLTWDEAEKVIGELKHRLRFASAPAAPAPTEKPGGVSAGQQRKIIALMCELRKCDAVHSTATIEQRVTGIIRREMKLSASEKDPYAWLTYKDGVRLIEIIKGYLETARRKLEAGSDAG